MRVGRQIAPGIVYGLLWMLPLSACGGATPPTPATPVAPTAAPAPAVVPMPGAESVLGHWARSANGCKQPELVFEATAARIQTDADGKAVRFVYERVRYTRDEPGQTTVELGKPHPYGKTPSKTALSFKRVSSDEIGLSQARRYVPFHRCANAPP